MRFANSIIPRSSQLKAGTYDFTIDSVSEDRYTDQRMRYAVVLRVNAPAAAEGRVHTERFWIGTESDVDGADPKTQTESIGAQNFGRLLDAVGFDKTDYDTETLFPAMAGLSFTGRINRKERKNAPGIFDAQLGRFYKLGEVPARLDDEGANGSAGAPRSAPTAAPKPVAVAAPRPTAPKPVAPRPAAAPVQRPQPASLPAGFEIEE